MTTPYQPTPESEPAERAVVPEVPGLHLVEYVEHTGDGKPGFLSAFRNLRRRGSIAIADEWVLADKTGEVYAEKDVVLSQIEIGDDTEIKIHRAERTKKGLVVAGAVIATSVVVAGTIRTITHKKS